MLGNKVPCQSLLDCRYSVKSDVWSFGVVLVELVTYGAKPYQGMSNKEVVSKLEQGYRMPCPSGCPDSLYKIMTDCWKTVGREAGLWGKRLFTSFPFRPEPN